MLVKTKQSCIDTPLKNLLGHLSSCHALSLIAQHLEYFPGGKKGVAFFCVRGRITLYTCSEWVETF